jgi:hypothetical protein
MSIQYTPHICQSKVEIVVWIPPPLELQKDKLIAAHANNDMK